MGILTAQEGQGKCDGIDGFGNELCLREEGTRSFFPSLAVTAPETLEIYELVSCSPMPLLPAP